MTKLNITWLVFFACVRMIQMVQWKQLTFRFLRNILDMQIF
ncbi:hypothetical protein DsansV1_C03g0028611 [Dioscorea sansibarensis]